MKNIVDELTNSQDVMHITAVARYISDGKLIRINRPVSKLIQFVDDTDVEVHTFKK